MDANMNSNGRASFSGHGPHTGGRTLFSPLDSFDRPIAFHRGFVTLTGSVTAALMLSQAVYWQRRTHDPEGWWWKTMEDWTEETGLSRKEQENARRRLKTIGLLEEERRGVPARLYFRVDLSILNSPPQPICEPNPQFAQKVQSRLPQTDKQDCPKRTNKFAPFGQSFKETETTSEITAKTTTTTTIAARPEPGSGSDSRDPFSEEDQAKPPALLFDGPLTDLNTAQQDRARRIVGKLDPETAQQVLDDWGQAIKTNSIRKSKWAWLDGVVRRAQAGTFIPTTDAAERRLAEERLRRAAQARCHPTLPQPMVTPANRPKGRPEGLRRLLKALAPGRGVEGEAG